jgi:hypothetical protein
MQQFFIKNLEVINRCYGTMTGHEYDGGSLFVSLNIYVDFVSVDGD